MPPNDVVPPASLSPHAIVDQTMQLKLAADAGLNSSTQPVAQVTDASAQQNPDHSTEVYQRLSADAIVAPGSSGATNKSKDFKRDTKQMVNAGILPDATIGPATDHQNSDRKTSVQPAGTLVTDAQGRVVQTGKGDTTRSFTYADNSDLVISYQEGGHKFTLDQDALKQNKLVYKGTDGSFAGRMNVASDGTIHLQRYDGSETFTKLDGSRLTRNPDGSTKMQRPDGKITETVDAKGRRSRYEYDLSTDVLGRPGQLSKITSGTEPNAEVWTTSDGYAWHHQGDKLTCYAFKSVNQDTGAYRESFYSGLTNEHKLDGSDCHHKDCDLSGSVDAVKGALGCFYDSNKLKWLRVQYEDKSPEQIYMMGWINDHNNPDALHQQISQTFASITYRKTSHGRVAEIDPNQQDHRWQEINSWFLRKGQTSEKSAAQLHVDATEMQEWWWSRDRSVDDIQSSTRNILGTATQQQLDDIKSAYRSMYRQELQDHLTTGDVGAAEMNGRFQSEALNLYLNKGRDKRTPQEEKHLMETGLASGPDNLEHFMEVSSQGRASDAGRQAFRDDQGPQKITAAFTEPVADESGGPGSSVVDTFKVKEAMDYAERGELKASTQLEKATGVFSNDDKAVEDALSRMTPEDRLQYADGRALAQSGKQREDLTTDQERAAFDSYQEMQSAMSGLHYVHADRKAVQYEDKVLHKGGTDIAERIAPIGSTWLNDHQTNLHAIESMSRQTFDQLMTGVTGDQPTVTGSDGKKYFSQYQQEFSDALAKNLGSGEYLGRAQTLLDDKVKKGMQINALADSGKLAELKAEVPALGKIPDEQYQMLIAGYQLQSQLAQGNLKEDDLQADQQRQLKAYRSDDILRPFLEGRTVAKELAEIDSGAQLANALDPNLRESSIAHQRESFIKTLSPAAVSSLDLYRQDLFGAVNGEVRRSLVDAINDNVGALSNDRRSMLDAITNMKPEERQRYRDDKQYQALVDRVIKSAVGDGDAAWKAADGLLAQIRNDKSNPPGAAHLTLAEELYAEAGIDGVAKKDVLHTISEALKNDKDGAVAKSLSADARYQEAAKLALGGNDDDYNTYVKPLIEKGRLPTDLLARLCTQTDDDNNSRLDELGYFKFGVLDSTPSGLKSLQGDANKSEREKFLGNLSDPNLKAVAEKVIDQGEVRSEDRIRLFVIGQGVDQEEAKAILRNMKEEDRRQTLQTYSQKYGGDLRTDVMTKVDNAERDEFFRLTRGADWDTETSYLEAQRSVADTTSGMGGALASHYNIMPQEALNRYAEGRYEAAMSGLQLTPEQREQYERAVADAKKAFQEDKQSCADTVATGVITVGALAAAPFTGGTSLSALLATGGVIAAGGAVGAATDYAVMGDDHNGFRQLTADFVKYSALTAANMVGPQHLTAALGLGKTAGTACATEVLEQAAFKGLSAEAKTRVTDGMVQIVRDGIAHGGVADTAIQRMVGSLQNLGMSDAAKAALGTALQQQLKGSVDAVAQSTLRQVIQTARTQAQSTLIHGVSGAAGNTVGEAGRELVTDGKLDPQRLAVAAGTGFTMSVGANTALRFGGTLAKRVLSAGGDHAPLETAAVGDRSLPRVDETSGGGGSGTESGAAAVSDWRAASLLERSGNDAPAADQSLTRSPLQNDSAAREFCDQVVPLSKSWSDSSIAGKLDDVYKRSGELDKQFEDLRVRIAGQLSNESDSGYISPEQFSNQQFMQGLLKDHPDLLNEYKGWRRATTDLSVDNMELNSMLLPRRDQLQQVVDNFTKQHGLPPVKLELADPAELGPRGEASYIRGKGVVRLKTALVAGNATAADVIDIVSHELAHSEQDSLLIGMYADSLKIGKSANARQIEALQTRFEQTSGVEINPAYLKQILDLRNGEPLSAEELARATTLQNGLDDYAKRSDVLKTRGQYIADTEARLQQPGGAQSLILQFNLIGNPRTYQRLFGSDAPPPEVLQLMQLSQDISGGKLPKSEWNEAQALKILQDKLREQTALDYAAYRSQPVEQEAWAVGQKYKEMAKSLGAHADAPMSQTAASDSSHSLLLSDHRDTASAPDDQGQWHARRPPSSADSNYGDQPAAETPTRSASPARPAYTEDNAASFERKLNGYSPIGQEEIRKYLAYVATNPKRLEKIGDYEFGLLLDRQENNIRLNDATVQEVLRRTKAGEDNSSYVDTILGALSKGDGIAANRGDLVGFLKSLSELKQLDSIDPKDLTTAVRSDSFVPGMKDLTPKEQIALASDLCKTLDKLRDRLKPANRLPADFDEAYKQVLRGVSGVDETHLSADANGKYLLDQMNRFGDSLGQSIDQGRRTLIQFLEDPKTEVAIQKYYRTLGLSDGNGPFDLQLPEIIDLLKQGSMEVQGVPLKILGCGGEQLAIEYNPAVTLNDGRVLYDCTVNESGKVVRMSDGTEVTDVARVQPRVMKIMDNQAQSDLDSGLESNWGNRRYSVDGKGRGNDGKTLPLDAPMLGSVGDLNERYQWYFQAKADTSNVSSGDVDSFMKRIAASGYRRADMNTNLIRQVGYLLDGNGKPVIDSNGAPVVVLVDYGAILHRDERQAHN
ncbi:MAG TPA: hypothetical protein V6C81_20860 [Planktothrix sp.]